MPKPTDLEHLILTRLGLRHIRQLSCVGRLGSMSRAAAELHISQPALSKTVLQIEAILGVRLFERTPRGLIATIPGGRLLLHCRAVESELRKAGQDLQAQLDGTGGQIAVGGYLVALPTLLPAAIGRLRAETHDVVVRVVDGSTHQLMPALLSGDLDLLVGRLNETLTPEHLRHEVLYNEPIVIIAGSGHPLTGRRKPDYRDLADHPWVLPTPDSVAHAPVAELFLAHGLSRPQSHVESISFMLIRSLLQDRDTLAAMPYHVVKRDVELGLLKILPLELPHAHLPVGITRHATRELGPLAERFLHCLRAAAKDMRSPTRQKPARTLQR